MEKLEKDTLTLEEAKSRLAEMLVKLAQNAIYHQDLIEEVKKLEDFIKSHKEEGKDE